MTKSTPPDAAFELTRDYLRGGGLADYLKRNNPDVRLLSDEERHASLAGVLADRTEHGDGLWVFAYGSLIWNPAMHIAGRQLARAPGWHRAFCLATKGGRGTPENPGMLLGLQQGGECVGAVLRVAEADIPGELEILWRREMVADGYIPRWIAVHSTDGTALGHAIAFTINPDGPSYCPPLPEDELVRRIATASGPLGSAADYLFNTRDGLRELGIRDAMLEALGCKVEALRVSMS